MFQKSNMKVNCRSWGHLLRNHSPSPLRLANKGSEWPTWYCGSKLGAKVGNLCYWKYWLRIDYVLTTWFWNRLTTNSLLTTRIFLLITTHSLLTSGIKTVTHYPIVNSTINFLYNTYTLLNAEKWVTTNSLHNTKKYDQFTTNTY